MSSLHFTSLRLGRLTHSYSLVACAIYYVIWVWVLPYYGGYRVRHERLELEGGEVTHVLTKVPVERMEGWDREHDAQGRKVDSDNGGSPVETEFHNELKGADVKI